MRRAVFVMIAVVIGCAASWAQTIPVPAEVLNANVVPQGRDLGPEWGTSIYVIATSPAVGCTTTSGGAIDTWQFMSGAINRYATSLGTLFLCPLHVPTGASIEMIELEGCDNSSSGGVSAILQKENSAAGQTVLDAVSSGGSPAPGCGWFQHALPTPYTVSNYYETYWFLVVTNPSDGSVGFTSVRAYYKLQVSPAPATATFADVPTSSPFFKYVEALYASGLIAGCGGGNYCPTSPVTRGQMAVYLAGALGMHWAY